MRQLKPETVERRKRDLLQWVIHNYIRTSRPVASSMIAEESGLDLSSATIRNILQELEEEGFLQQPHSSSGRQPTDKGYRFYVDYLMDAQRLAATEKERLERSYRSQISEMDTLLAETSKLLSRASHAAGLVLSTQMRDHVLKRLEIIPVGGRNVLAIMVTETGMVRHWPIRLSFEPTARRINALNRFLHEHVQGTSIAQAQAAVSDGLRQVEVEIQELGNLAGELLKEVADVMVPEALYMDGADSILTHADEIGDMAAVQSLIHLLNERQAVVGMLEGEFRRQAGPAGAPGVRIGVETGIKQLSGLSLVTKTYRYKDQPVGVLGILGSKRMEYSRIMALVDYVSEVVTRRLGSWEDEGK